MVTTPSRWAWTADFVVRVRALEDGGAPMEAVVEVSPAAGVADRRGEVEAEMRALFLQAAARREWPSTAVRVDVLALTGDSSRVGEAVAAAAAGWGTNPGRGRSAAPSLGLPEAGGP